MTTLGSTVRKGKDKGDDPSRVPEDAEVGVSPQHGVVAWH